MKASGVVAALVAGVLTALPAVAEVKIAFERGGRVTLMANDAPIQDVLMTWAAEGQTVITNVEHVGDERVTLALENVTESEALRALLGRQPGYIAMPRRMNDAGTSAYARVMILGIQADRNRPLRSDATTVQPGPDPKGRPALPVRRPMFGESSAAPTGTGDDSQGTRVPGVIARDPAAPMRPSPPSTSDSAASTGSRRPGTIDRPQALPPSLEPPHPEAR